MVMSPELFIASATCTRPQQMRSDLDNPDVEAQCPDLEEQTLLVAEGGLPKKV